MHWREVLRDVEAQAEAAGTAMVQHEAERHAQRARAERRSCDRLVDVRGRRLEIRTTAGLIVRGRLCASGPDWIQMQDHAHSAGSVEVIPLRVVAAWRLMAPDLSEGHRALPAEIGRWFDTSFAREVETITVAYTSAASTSGTTAGQEPDLLRVLQCWGLDHVGVTLTLEGGTTLRGQVLSVGTDHVDIAGDQGPWVVPVSQVVRITVNV